MPKNVPRLIALLMGLLLVSAGGLSAQSVSGSVLKSIDQSPLVGVVVLLIDSEQDVVARTLSGANGAWTVRAPSPGQYSLRTLRIGFRSSTTEPFSVTGDTSIVLLLDQLPVNLPQITAQEISTCRENPQRSLATAILWEEAKTAILSADITIRELDYRFDVMLHSRKYDTRTPPELLEALFIREQHQGTRPWSSFPPDTLEQRGYVTPTDSGLRYVAPDLEVLLSPYFTRTHCFRMREQSRTAAGEVALEFWPLSTIRRPEIRGLLRFDADSRHLKSVAFSYVNLPATVRDTVAGGEIEFTQLPNGAWILPRWIIRAPIPVRGFLGDTVRSAGTAVHTWTYLSTDAPQSSLLRVTGGDVVSVRPRDQAEGRPLWSRPSSSLEVRVVSADSTGAGVVPVQGAAVAFAGSAMQEITDERGIARFPGMVEGAFVVEASTPQYNTLRVDPERSTVRIPGDTGVVNHEIRIKTLPELVGFTCGLDMRAGVLAGSVLRGGGALGRARVLVEPVPGSPGADEIGQGETMTGIDGRYAICRMPFGAEFYVTVVAPDGERIRRNVMIEPGESVTYLDVVYP